MTRFTFTHGDVDESLSIMREAAQWLIDTGKPLWSVESLTRETINCPPEDYIVMHDAHGTGVATLLLCEAGKLDLQFWADLFDSNAGYIHKIAVRRAYAGRSLIRPLMNYAIAECKTKGITSLRLDCANREALCQVYKSLGFTLRETKDVSWGDLKFNVALFEMAISTHSDGVPNNRPPTIM